MLVVTILLLLSCSLQRASKPELHLCEIATAARTEVWSPHRTVVGRRAVLRALTCLCEAYHINVQGVVEVHDMFKHLGNAVDVVVILPAPVRSSSPSLSSG